MKYQGYLALILLVSAAAAREIPLPASSSPQTFNATKYDLQQLTSQAEFANLSAPDARCSSVYGDDVSTDSCLNALEKMRYSTSPKTYIPRHRNRAQPLPLNYVSMPVRYLSDDGICAIDLILAAVRRSLNLQGFLFGFLT